jgi:hypothetical protein
MAQIIVQNFSTHWSVKVIKNGKIVRVHTGQASNKAYQKKILKNLKMIYKVA